MLCLCGILFPLCAPSLFYWCGLFYLTTTMSPDCFVTCTSFIYLNMLCCIVLFIYCKTVSLLHFKTKKGRKFSHLNTKCLHSVIERCKNTEKVIFVVSSRLKYPGMFLPWLIKSSTRDRHLTCWILPPAPLQLYKNYSHARQGYRAATRTRGAWVKRYEPLCDKNTNGTLFTSKSPR